MKTIFSIKCRKEYWFSKLFKKSPSFQLHNNLKFTLKSSNYINDKEIYKIAVSKLYKVII